MNYLLKLIYKFHREKFLDFAVAEFYENIPKRVTDAAITILEDKRKSVDDWILFQAYVLQRRVASNMKAVDTTFGMLLQLKLMQHMISGGRISTPDAEGTIPASAAQRDREIREELDSALQGVKHFIKKEKPTEKDIPKPE